VKQPAPQDRTSITVPTAAASEVGLLDLALVFLKVGATGFGGAMPMLALIHSEVVEKRRWVRQQDFDEAVMLGQILPGPVAVDAVTHIGHLLRGWPGAVVSIVAFILPSFLLMILLTALYLSYGSVPQMAGALKGLGTAVVALIVAAGYRLGRPALNDWRAALLLVAAMLALLILQANVVLIVALAGLAGLALYRDQPASPIGPQNQPQREVKP
jgi:chromate transporter